MRRLMEELLDKWAPQGGFDFAEFAADYPIAVMCALIGVSAAPIPRLRKSLEAQLTAISMNKAAMPDFMRGYEVMYEFADEVVREREASGQHDPDLALDIMIAAKRAGQLTERELRYLIMVLLFAGYDTSKNMLTMTMHLLLEQPQVYRRCAQDLAYCGLVIDEALRHSNIATPVRQVQQSFVYDNFRFDEGAIVYMATPLSGRDPRPSRSRCASIPSGRARPATPPSAAGRTSASASSWPASSWRKDCMWSPGGCRTRAGPAPSTGGRCWAPGA
jgi:cytochrome P450